MRIRLLIHGAALVIFLAPCAWAQRAASETFTGTVVGIGPRRTVSRPFTLTITGRTSSSEVAREVAVLAERGQDALLNTIKDRSLGRFSLVGQVGRPLNFVTETTTSNGERKIMVLFERWMNIYELRYGTRSTDYPFGYVELIVDRNGRGGGSFFPAAQVSFDNNQIEVEHFGVYPARLMGVRRRN